MFGAFRPSGPLSGGLLWKIPWRMSNPQKLRQRRRLRRVDNIVSVLDTALKRQVATHPISTTTATSSPPPTQSESETHGAATPAELSTTAEGQRLLSTTTHVEHASRRQGRGPKQGDLVPGQPRKLLSEQAGQLGTIKLLERWKAEMPTEQEMHPRDKYTMFDRKAKGYRKGVHKLPKWTRVSQRLNPPGF
ncbi:hypothetical protein LTR36_004040 [Oleoguttula mirabilis]|uniref:54S ribosomal protein L31, mitochondrial n=1 Tax=Oleoguttula mirabilis TaxID=1507867 RepID=A0AAV9JIU2_9PEZI|nr:hypothetical protein LTR36_004040 [Oleoguttula mirabilis]